jgi:hypothetical protein
MSYKKIIKICQIVEVMKLIHYLFYIYKEIQRYFTIYKKYDVMT